MIDELRQIVRDHAASAPRSKQTDIGISEVGSPCSRRLAYKMLRVEPVNFDTDPWASIVGTATHAWLDKCFAKVEVDGERRFATELRVELPGYFRGTIDVYDTATCTVIDHKVVGAASLKRYKTGDVGDQYRTQVHLYACALRLRGHQVDNVAIVFWSRSGGLRDACYWSEPYDERIVKAALQRYDALKTITAAGTSALPMIPTGDAFCLFCPYYCPGVTDVEVACGGHTVKASNPTQQEITL